MDSVWVVVICSSEEVGSLWRLLAVLLHLGNLEYSWDEDENSHVQLISPQVRPLTTGQAGRPTFSPPIYLVRRAAGHDAMKTTMLPLLQVELSVIAEMMGTTPLELSKGICSRSTSSARGSTLCIPLTLEQTRNNVQVGREGHARTLVLARLWVADWKCACW